MTGYGHWLELTHKAFYNSGLAAQEGISQLNILTIRSNENDQRPQNAKVQEEQSKRASYFSVLPPPTLESSPEHKEEATRGTKIKPPAGKLQLL